MTQLRTFITVILLIAAVEVEARNGNGYRYDTKIVVAYVTASDDEPLPDPQYMTHMNYAFGHVNATHDGVEVANPSRLHRIVALKAKKPTVNVLLSIGGWTAGGFSEMAANDSTRRAFALDCRHIIDEYHLDGIDIDWEYPTSSEAGIASSPADTKNYTLLMRDIRTAIGEDKLLTLASVCTAQYIDFPSILPYIDFVNVMSYDMDRVPKHSSALYRSPIAGKITVSESIKAHLKAGVPTGMIVMGVPFYGRGWNGYPDFMDWRHICLISDDYRYCWDNVAKVPYIADRQGTLSLCFDNPRSMKIKCHYILREDLLGVMYWEYKQDDTKNTLRRLVAKQIMGKKHKTNK